MSTVNHTCKLIKQLSALPALPVNQVWKSFIQTFSILVMKLGNEYSDQQQLQHKVLVQKQLENNGLMVINLLTWSWIAFISTSTLEKDIHMQHKHTHTQNRQLHVPHL